MSSDCDSLKLENQLCFPLYVASKEVVRRYRPYLSEMDLTYTQYITMLALWEEGEMKVNELGDKLYLDSGTLTPLLKNLEKKGYISRGRCSCDERAVCINLTEEGKALKEKASGIPGKIGECMPLNEKDSKELKRILSVMIADF